jgi:hypothetical protein
MKDYLSPGHPVLQDFELAFSVTNGLVMIYHIRSGQISDVG